LALVSCSLDYSSAFLAAELARETPDTVFEDLVYVVIRNNAENFRIQAERGENYTKLSESRFYKINFTELNPAGEILTSGSCDEAFLFTDTHNIELRGNLAFYSAQEKAWLTADRLFWSDEQKELTGDPEGQVELALDSGTRIEGGGFSALARDRTVRFDGGVQGSWVEKAEEEGEEP
jgi:LPS export ABC transporter protein LptC